MLDAVLYVLIGALLAFFVIKVTKKENDVVTIVTEKEEPQTQPLLPYWMYYGQPSYWPVYLSPYWFYDVPYYGPITGGSYKPWGSGGRSSYRPAYWAGRGGGHSGVAVGGGGSGASGGHGGH